MRRIDITEIHEQPWLPHLIRDEITDSLEVLFGFLHAYRPVAAQLSEAARACGAERFLDLCSGGGGPWLWLQKELAASRNGAVPVCLTDKFPNAQAFERAKNLSHGAIDYVADSIDATKLPASLTGFRTIFSSFHHFTPLQVRAILEDAVAQRQGIGIFELAQRRPKAIAFTFFVPLGVLLTAPFARPFRLSRLIFTYLIPVVPLVLWIDGILSCLRAYLPDEMREMCAYFHAPGYVWEIGVTPGQPIPVAYLVGYPNEVSF